MGRVHAQGVWTVMSGSGCELSSNGMCVSDGDGDYGNYETCTVRAEAAIVVSAQAFDTEANFDFVNIGDTSYSGTSGPVSVTMSAGQTLHWYSDSWTVRSGFNICAVPVVSTLPESFSVPTASCVH
jgi:hypothetical protein